MGKKNFPTARAGTAGGDPRRAVPRPRRRGGSNRTGTEPGRIPGSSAAGGVEGLGRGQLELSRESDRRSSRGNPRFPGVFCRKTADRVLLVYSCQLQTLQTLQSLFPVSSIHRDKRGFLSRSRDARKQSLQSLQSLQLTSV
jgi:hypothetical protein